MFLRVKSNVYRGRGAKHCILVLLFHALTVTNMTGLLVNKKIDFYLKIPKCSIPLGTGLR